MKEDFREIKRELDSVGILRIAQDFYMEPMRKGSNYFVRSPATADKTSSLCLYPSSSRFCDFANGNKSGDIIGLVAYVRGCNQWEALQELKSFYSLSGHDGWHERKERIERQKAQEEHKRRRQQDFKAALVGEIDSLKRWEDILSLALEKRLYTPYSEMWMYCQNELCQIKKKLDVLCASDVSTYRRMKESDNIPSDRWQWALDTLGILAEAGLFHATESELNWIKAKRNEGGVIL